MSQTVKSGYFLVHIPATDHCGMRYNVRGGGQGMSVSEVDITPKLGPSVNSILLLKIYVANESDSVKV